MIDINQKLRLIIGIDQFKEIVNMTSEMENGFEEFDKYVYMIPADPDDISNDGVFKINMSDYKNYEEAVYRVVDNNKIIWWNKETTNGHLKDLHSVVLDVNRNEFIGIISDGTDEGNNIAAELWQAAARKIIPDDTNDDAEGE